MDLDLRRSRRFKHPRWTVSFATDESEEGTTTSVADTEHSAAYPRVQIAFDLGTTSNSACFRILNSADDTKAAIFEVKAKDEDDQESFPSLFWYDPDGNFYTGYELVAKIRREEVPRDQVITMAKLILYDGPETRQIREEVMAQLARFRKTEEDFWRDDLEALVKQAFAYIQEYGSGICGDYTVQQLSLMPHEFLFTSPQTFDPSANAPLTMAAKSLNADLSMIVSEPICLATAIFEQIDKSPNNGARQSAMYAAQRGLTTMFLDVGGGYAITTVVRYRQDPLGVHNLQMELLIPPLHYPCGSSMVNRSFKNWFQTCPRLTNTWGSVACLAKTLGFREEELLAHAEDLFETVKRSFNDGAPRYSITFSAKEGLGDWVLRITRDEITQLMAPVIEQVSNLVHKTVTAIELSDVEGAQQPATIFLSGGFAKCNALREVLRKNWEPKGIEVKHWNDSNIHCPNPRGALLRHRSNIVQRLDKSINLALVRDEELDPSCLAHRDAFDVTDGEIVPKDILTMPGENDETTVWATDRLHWIFKNGKELKEVPSDHYPARGEPFAFLQEVIYSRRGDGKNGEPLWEEQAPTYDEQTQNLDHIAATQFGTHPGVEEKVKPTFAVRAHLKLFSIQNWTIKRELVNTWGRYKHPNGEITHAIRIHSKISVGDGHINIGFKVVDRVGARGNLLSEKDVTERMRTTQAVFGIDENTRLSTQTIWSAKHNHLLAADEDASASDKVDRRLRDVRTRIAG